MSRIVFLVVVFDVAAGMELVSQQQNVTRSPNMAIMRDYGTAKTVFSAGEKQDFLTGATIKCGAFFLKGQMPTGIGDANPNLKYICQRYKISPYFATMFNPETKTAYYSAYKPNIGYKERPSWSDLYEHGLYDYDAINNKQYYGIDTRAARPLQSFPYSVVAKTQGTDRTYFRGGLTFKIDRGHLNPSGINSNNENKMKATLTYTNLVPQFSGLNQEAWRLAEITIRQFISKQCDPKKTYLLTGTVPSQMYLGYDDNYIDKKDDEIPKSAHPRLCKEGPGCVSKYKVNIPSYMWTAGACHVGLGNCKTFSVLAKNDGNENAVGFYTLQALENFLGAKSLQLSTCWMNHKKDAADIENVGRRNEQKDQVLHAFPNDVPVSLFPGCANTVDYSKEFDKHFKSQGWSHFLHSHIPSLVETKRQELLKNINLEANKYKGQPNVFNLLGDIYKTIEDLDNIVDSDLTSKPVSNCNF